MKLLYLVESGESKFLVFDEMPDKISTKYGDDTIIGRIGGIFYDFLAKRNERREAFGGRKFDIVLDNGEIEKCEGQWWDAATDRAREELEKEGKWNSTVVEFTRENVLKQLEEDVRFGFEKALNQRGISASLMFECVMMWNYILEEGLEDWDEDDYGFYGLPLFKATAVKYGWDNPIGEDSGRERKYDSQY